MYSSFDNNKQIMILTKQNIEKQQFSIFIRDLSSSLNTNLKHIIEDTLKNEPVVVKHKKGKKPVIKKKDIIILKSEDFSGNIVFH